MKFKILSLFLGLALLSACEGAFDVEGDYDIDPADRGSSDTLVINTDDDDTPADSPADTIQQQLTGEELYIAQCGTCHGEDGKGAQAWPLSIERYFPIYGIVKDGQGTMPSIAMTDDEIGLVQNFLMDM